MSVKTKKSHTLLLVEDNRALNAMLCEFLEDAGYAVLSFKRAEDIPAAIRFDVAVLDLNLPGEDGLSLAARLKSANPNVGIILLTIRSELSDKLKGYEVGADVFLAKPVDPSELVAVLASLIKRLPADNSRFVSAPKKIAQLSEKETELLRCISHGRSYSDAAAELGVSLSTVQSHIRSIYRKLGAHSKFEAVEIARKINLI
jgi:DNA-binding NarL/FixJ family response regulator